MALQIYPRPKRKRRDKSGRPWRVDYHLIYDCYSAEWKQYYRTKLGARISAWWNYHVESWGGHAVLVNQKEE